ncbi:MAG: hypothetical protein V1724_03825 [Chloroflexota bacterium]
MATVGSGKYTHEMNEQQARLPKGWEMPAAAAAYSAGSLHPMVSTPPRQMEAGTSV